MRYLLLLMLSIFAISSLVHAQSPATADYLRCEYRVDPLGIDVTSPRLSWEMQDARRGAMQTAYRIMVSSTLEKLSADQGDLWDTGKVASNQSTQLPYAGKPLASRMRCHWKVKIWDHGGKESPWSKPALWTMGLLNSSEWKAKWVGYDGEFSSKKPTATWEGSSWVWYPEGNPVESAPVGKRYFRHTFKLPIDRKIKQANFYLLADNNAILTINGKEAGRCDSFKSTATYTVADKLQTGENVLAIEAENDGDKPTPAGVMGKLVIRFESGEPVTIKIDDAWKTSDKSEKGWETLQFDASAWKTAKQTAKAGEGPWGMPTIGQIPIMGCPLLRKEFKIEQPIRRATLYASSLGIYQMHLNGKPVGDDYFTPDWTDYNKRVYYNTYDVTAMLKQGPNAIGGILGPGWYSGAIAWIPNGLVYGEHPRLFAQLEIELQNGEKIAVVTDPSWKGTDGPYIEGEFLAGEIYDATREIPGWNQPGLNDSAWKPVAVTEKYAGVIEAFPGVTVQQTGVVKPVKITEPKPGAFVFDMGQNFTGIERLKLRGPKGTRVVIRFAERLNPDGTIYTTNLRGARCIDTYVLKGEGEEIYQPRFTFRCFQYVEITGYPGKPDESCLTGIAINSAIPMAGSFECSNANVNKLYSNIVWTQRANYLSVPTDCPQRDERLGWMGDAQAFIRTGTYNSDVGAFFTKWLVDVQDAQDESGAFPHFAPRASDPNGASPAWADAGVICPMTIYQVYNDKRLLEKDYPGMVKWVEYCRKHSKDYLRPADGFGDWLSINANTPGDVLATAFFAQSAKLTADAAKILGKEEDAKKYSELSEQIKAAFNKAYVKPDGTVQGNTQTCYVMALAFDLLPVELREKAMKHLLDDLQTRGNLSTGFVGTYLLMPTLSRMGQTPMAYKLFLTDTFPSWLFEIKHGATSIWERWDGWTPERGFQDPGMNSFAHYAFGAVGQWMFQTVAGIDLAEPGYRKILIKPEPGKGIDWVKASYRSPQGKIATAWRKEGGKLLLDVTIPANTTAQICLPIGKDVPAASIQESGKQIEAVSGIKLGKRGDSGTLLEVGSGEYHFTMPWKAD